ncbi:MAG: hypothetical protein KDD11_20775 [Acidobacteria bacterium]|nr:hypothetical protein [Acidobacteriota bacterium]
MSTKKRRFFSGSTLEQAVIAAASEYQLAPAEVAYKKVEKRHGFLRAQRRVIIEVDPANPKLDEPGEGPPPLPTRRPVDAGFTRITRGGVEEPEDAVEAEEAAEEPEAAASEGEPPRREKGGRGQTERGGRDGRREHQPEGRERRSGSGRDGGRERREKSGEPRGEARPAERRGKEPEERRPAAKPPEEGRKAAKPAAPREEPEMDLMEAAEIAVDRLLAVTDLDVDFDLEIEGDRVAVDLGGPECDVLLEDQGKALFSIELLVPILIRGLCGERVFCHVDASGYRADREDELRELALEMAEEVVASGEEKTLDWLNPAERRVVHMALADHEGVETESEGRGYLKRLTIWPL